MIVNNEHKLCRAFGRLCKSRNTLEICSLYLIPFQSNSGPTAPEASALPLSYRPLFQILKKSPTLGLSFAMPGFARKSTLDCRFLSNLLAEKFNSFYNDSDLNPVSEWRNYRGPQKIERFPRNQQEPGQGDEE